MERLAVLARRNHGYLTAAEAARSGYGSWDLSRAVTRGVLVRLRRGVYAFRSDADGWSSRDRHAVLLRSALAELGESYVATHASAAVLHDLDTDRLDTDVAHVASLTGATSRRSNGVQVHRGRADPSTVVTVDGIRTVDAAHAVAECTTTAGLAASTVLVSSWLRAQRSDARRRGMLEEFDQEVHRAQLGRVLHGFGGRPGTRNARDALAIADGRCDNGGEVLVLVLCWRFDIPRPETQRRIDFERGRWAEVDFLWVDARHIVEFDGKRKYAPEPNRSAEDKVMAEKARERRLNDAGYGVTRIVWADLAPNRQAATAARIRRDMERSRRLYVVPERRLPY